MPSIFDEGLDKTEVNHAQLSPLSFLSQTAEVRCNPLHREDRAFSFRPIPSCKQGERMTRYPSWI